MFKINESSDAVVEDYHNDVLDYSVEFLNSITITYTRLLLPCFLKLKVGCIVMLLRNLNPTLGLCNGTRPILERQLHVLLMPKLFVVAIWKTEFLFLEFVFSHLTVNCLLNLVNFSFPSA